MNPCLSMNTWETIALSIPFALGTIVLGCLLGWGLTTFANWMDHR